MPAEGTAGEHRFPRHAGYLFDLDGTLVDTAPDLCAALNYALTAFGHSPVGLSLARGWVGQGAAASLRRALAHRGAPAQQAEAMLASFLDFYRGNIAVASQPFADVEDTLGVLRGRGAKLAVVTNKRKDLAMKLLAEIDLAGQFDAVVGGDSTANMKPAPDPAVEACRLLGVAPAEALFVGDSSADVGCARAAGCPVVCVAYGYRNGADPESLGADAVIATFAALL